MDGNKENKTDTKMETKRGRQTQRWMKTKRGR